MNLRNRISSSYLNEHPLAFIFIVASLAIWTTTVTIGVSKLFDYPYLGMVLEGDSKNRQVFVRSIAENTPAARAGIVSGDKFIAIETADGASRHDFAGPEVYSGRQRIHSYQEHDEMLALKRELWKFTQMPELVLVKSDGERVLVKPDERRKLTSSFSFTALMFVLLFQSLLILVVSVGIFAFAKRSTGVNVLLVAGLGWSINAMANAFIITREIMLDPALYNLIHMTSKAGSTAFIYALVCLVWYVPKPIIQFPFWQTMLGIGTFVYLAQTFQFYEFPYHPYELPNLILLPLGILISVAQWKNSRTDPINRATAQWMMMSIYGALLIVVILYSVPLLLKQQPLINPLIASFIWLFTFIGLALGTLRYKLFEVQKYWWKAIVWILGGALVVLLDLALISQFDFTQSQALPIALLLSGWIYFPVRQFVFEYFVSSKDTKVNNHVVDLIETFGATKTAPAFEEKFAQFLKHVFRADAVSAYPDTVITKSQIRENGLGLWIPNIARSGSLEVHGKANGKQLFSSGDTTTADSFVQLIRNLKDMRLQEQQTLEEERERIVRDLHDDVGGKLLSMIYKSPDSEIEEEARATLVALKESMIAIEDSERVDLELAWEQIFAESKERLKQAGFPLVSTGVAGFDGITLSTRQYINLKRITQELVSNIIKHAQRNEAADLSLVASDDTMLELSCKNTPNQRLEDTILDGRGMSNIRKRVEEIGGDCEFADDGQVFSVSIRLPLSHP